MQREKTGLDGEICQINDSDKGSNRNKLVNTHEYSVCNIDHLERMMSCLLRLQPYEVESKKWWYLKLKDCANRFASILKTFESGQGEWSVGNKIM